MALEKRTVFAAFGRVGIVAGIVVAFVLGMAGAVYLSLRSREVPVPNVVGQHYLKGQDALEEAQLNIRRRAKRFKDDAPPDTILDQSPRAGEVVKVGQTIAVVVSDEESGKNAPPPDGQSPPEGQASPSPTPAPAGNANENQNRNANNRNANRNANNRNANNRNANNRNANNANNRNGNANNRNANGNANRPNANGNRNANARTPNANANRPNANAGRPNTNGGATNRNANRRPTP